MVRSCALALGPGSCQVHGSSLTALLCCARLEALPRTRCQAQRVCSPTPLRRRVPRQSAVVLSYETRVAEPLPPHSNDNAQCRVTLRLPYQLDIILSWWEALANKRRAETLRLGRRNPSACKDGFPSTFGAASANKSRAKTSPLSLGRRNPSTFVFARGDFLRLLGSPSACEDGFPSTFQGVGRQTQVAAVLKHATLPSQLGGHTVR